MLTATYSPEDNKLRLYSTAKLGQETYARVKAAGFKWAPKQELFVAPAWTPAREDLLIELCGEVGDEDTSLVERQEQRADRFEELSDRREADADRAKAAVDAIADAIPFGQPILVGHHSERHARKDKERIETGMRRAVGMWKLSQYWADRARGAIRHAKYKERPDVRARRIKGLEADERKQQKYKAEAERFLRLYSKEGLTLEQCRAISNYSHLSACPHPTLPQYWSAWDVLRPDGERYEGCPGWTVEQVQERAKEAYPRMIAGYDRWLEHLANRLTYERAMLAEAGGLETDKTGPEKGGAVRCWASPGHGRGWSFIKKVNKVSVTVEDNWGNGGRNFTRTIPFDKLAAVMTAAQVEAARAAGRLHLADCDTGFYLTDEPPPPPRPQAEPDAKAEAFERLAEVAKAGVQVVTAPQLFPTPPEIAAQVVRLAEVQSGHTVLEPSAGTGALLDAVYEAQPFAEVYAVEINPTLHDALKGRVMDSRCGDFLELNGELGEFDRIVMNPPFANGSDIKHVLHALAKLKTGGRLVSIVANGPRQREKLEPLATAWIDLPAGTFKEQGTGVNTAIVVIDK